MNYQKLIISGDATADPVKKTSKDEEVTYTRFNIGVGDGKYWVESVATRFVAFG